MSSKRPYMPLYIAAYRGDTVHLTTEQHGAYLLLLMDMWNRDGELPNDPHVLSRIAGSSSKRWSTIWKAIRGFFMVVGDTLRHKRIDIEIRRMAKVSQSRSEAAQKRHGSSDNAISEEPKVASDRAQNVNKNNKPDDAIARQPRARAHDARARRTEGAETPDSRFSESPHGDSSNAPAALSTEFSKRDVQHEPKERPEAPPEFHLEADPDPERVTSGKGAKQDEKGFRRSLAHLCLDPEIIDNIIIAKRNRRAPITALAGRQLAANLLACGTGNVEEAALLMIEKGWQTMKPEYFQRENARYGPANGNRRPSMLDEHIDDMRRRYNGQPATTPDSDDGFLRRLASGG